MVDKHGQKKTFRLVDRVSSRWRKFGILLGLTMNQLEAWDDQHRGNASICWNKVMEYWLAGDDVDDYPATWEGLYTLLNDCTFSEVAADLKRIVSGCCMPFD